MSNYETLEYSEYARMFKALSNPHRLRIFLRLMDCCAPDAPRKSEDDIKACVGVIGRDLGIVPSTVSHHIKELFNAGLIHMERRGQNVECWIERDTLKNISELFEGWSSAANV